MNQQPPLTEWSAGVLQWLILFTGDVFQDLLHRAVQNSAQVVNGSCGQGLVLAELVDGGAGNAVIFDQCVGRLAGSAKRSPKRPIGNHTVTS